MAREVVERVIVTGESDGLKEVARDLDAVADAQDNVASATKAAETVTQRSATVIARTERALESQRRKLDDVYRSQADYSKGLGVLNQGLEYGLVSAAEYGHRVELLGQKFGIANQNVRLTSEQVRNLGFQLNDAATMLASGSSPFQVIATQGGQVFQALQEGSGGVRGSLQAIGDAALDAAKRIGPVGLALGATSIAAAGLWFVFRDKVKPIDELLKQQADSVKALGEAYGLANAKVEEFGRRSSEALQADAERSQRETKARLNLSAVDALAQLAPFDASGLAKRSAPAFRELKEAADAFRASVAAGNPDFFNLDATLGKISSSTTDVAIRKFADSLREAIAPNVALQQSVTVTGKQLDAAGVAALRMGEAYRTAMAGLSSLAPDVRTEAQRINDLFADAAANARSMGEVNAVVRASNAAMKPIEDAANAAFREERAKRSVVGLGEEAAAIAQVTARYDDLRASVAGNEKAVAAYDQAQREAIATIKDQSAYDAAKKSGEEADRARAKTEAATKAAADATRNRLSGMDATVRGLQTEVSTLGMAEGVAQAFRFETEALATAKAAAGAAGVVSDAELTKIREASAEIARLTDTLAAQSAGKAALDRFFPFEAASREAERLGGYIADVNNGLSDTERYALQLQIDQGFVDATNAVNGLQGGLQGLGDEFGRVGDFAEDAFGGLIDALTRGGDLMENLMGFAADLGRQLADLGAKKLFGDVFGRPQAANDNRGGTAASIFSGVGGASASSGSPAYDAVASAPLRALNDNLSKVGRSALDVARQFNGLNERADSRVLDSFLRTSGNWKNLSASDTAWCAAFANAAIMQSGGQGTGSNLASSFMGWGTGTNAPKVGDIVVLKPQARGASGHVGFVAGFGDGTVQVFGGNQSGGANTRSFGLDQVRGYRTSGTSSPATQAYADQRIVQRGVAEGLRDYSRQYSPSPSRQAQAAMANGSFDGFAHNSAGSGMFSQNGLSVLGAGFGAFGAGYQSGSPFSGGLSGALGGYQAGGAISGMLGIGAGAGAALGVVGGAALGILGGILGARKQRAEAHKQAAEQWEQMRPQYEAFDQSLSGEGKGGIREWLTSTWSQLSGFMAVGGKAWKNGTGNSTAQFQSTGTKMFARFHEMIEEFRDGFNDMVEDLSSGEGLAGAFAKGRAATKDLQKQIDGMLDDVAISFGSADIGIPTIQASLDTEKEWEARRNEAIERAKKAAGEYSLSLLFTASTTSDVAKSLDGFRGTAAGLNKVLIDLGWSADQAATDINDRLNQAIAKMGETFVDGFQRQINDLSDKGYLNDIADIIKSRDSSLADAKLLGVDPAIVTKWFDLAAQDVVNGAELAGDAFADLIKAFPTLSGVVKEFTDASEAAGMTLKEIGEALNRAAVSRYEQALQERTKAEDALRSAYDRTVDRVKSIREYLSSSALNDEYSTLSSEGQFLEAQRLARETLFKANGGDVDAQDRLLDVMQDYRDEAKSFYGSSAKYAAVDAEIASNLSGFAAKLETELDVARRQANFLEEIAGGTRGLSDLLQKYLEADRAVGGSLSQLDANRQWGVRPVANRKNVAEFRAAGLPEYTGNFGPGTWPQIEAWLNTLTLAQRDQAMGIMTANNAIQYATGGLVRGPGTGTSDSIMARLSNGEFVMPAAAVRSIGLEHLESMRQTMRLPVMPAMSLSMPAANDSAALLERLDALADEVSHLGQIIHASDAETRTVIAQGNRSSKRAADALALDAA